MSRHSIARIAIPARNREALARFYHDLFGWKIEPVPGPPPTLIFDAGEVGGHFPPVDGPLFSHGDLTVFVESEDLDADLKHAQSLGATVIKGKADVPGVGQIAILVDPLGSRIGLWARPKRQG